ncbi:acetyltransferase (putative) [Vibrio cholerae]|nr:acetyltransferase (putative) [Vibrio cholerae]
MLLNGAKMKYGNLSLKCMVILSGTLLPTKATKHILYLGWVELSYLIQKLENSRHTSTSLRIAC